MSLYAPYWGCARCPCWLHCCTKAAAVLGRHRSRPGKESEFEGILQPRLAGRETKYSLVPSRKVLGLHTQGQVEQVIVNCAHSECERYDSSGSRSSVQLPVDQPLTVEALSSPPLVTLRRPLEAFSSSLLQAHTFRLPQQVLHSHHLLASDAQSPLVPFHIPRKVDSTQRRAKCLPRRLSRKRKSCWAGRATA